jgi:hypothetical protein
LLWSSQPKLIESLEIPEVRMEYLVAGGVVVLFLGAWLISQLLEKKRTAELAALADELSLSFLPQGDALLLPTLSDVSLLQRGRSRTMSNLLRGNTRSVDFSLFDYSYVTGSGKNRSVHRFTVAAFDTPLLHLPDFELTPENLFHKLAGAFGYQDIDFAGFPAFNRKYLLRGPSEQAIRDLFTEDVVQHFDVGAARGKPASVFGSRSRLLIATRRRKPHEIRGFMEDAFTIYGVFRPAAVSEQPELAPLSR